MNEAARSQAESARQSVTEAWRGQLRLLRDRVESYWKGRADAVARDSGAGTPTDFARAVTSGFADSVILFDSAGAATYPALPPTPRLDTGSGKPDWMAARELEAARPSDAAGAWAKIAASEIDPSFAARAAQAQVRCLVRSGQPGAAIGTIEQRFTAGPAARGLDLQDRLIAADEYLFAVRLMKPSDARFVPMVRRLAALLNDYRVAMPSAQRLFLMDELRAAVPGQAVFPTRDAEALAAGFLEVGTSTPGDPGVVEQAGTRAGPPVQESAGRPPILWKLTASNGRAIALYRNETVLQAMSTLLNGHTSRGVTFAAIPPGGAGGEEAISAGAALPGWQLSYTLTDSSVSDEAARRRRTAYLWAGFLAVAAIAVAGLIAAQAFRRQWRLARLKTDMVAAVSHELKTPLSSMHVLVDGLLEDKELDPGKTREYLELIGGENRRLSRLIDNFLTFSRIERHRLRFDLAGTNPGDVVRAAIDAMGERLRPPACTLEVDVPPELPAMRADKDALVSALLNLLDNAYKYTPRNRRIRVEAYREDGNVVFAVRDNGIGIAPRDRERIFRRFYQADRRLARETGGCGLGLSIVEYIVKAHGGSVLVESKPGEGSAFRILIPISEEVNA
jgi:signal transduction histidine kinase